MTMSSATLGKRAQMLRILVLIIISILIFVPILNCAGKYILGPSGRSLESYNKFTNNIEGLIASPTDVPSRVQVAALDDASGIFAFAPNAEYVSLVSITRDSSSWRPSLVDHTMVNLMQRPAEDICAKDALCACHCPKGLSYKYYQGAKISDREYILSLSPPPDVGFPLQGAVDWQYAFFILSCEDLACKEITSQTPTLKPRQAIHNPEFVASHKDPSYEEYVIGGFILWRHNKQRSSTPKGNPLEQVPAGLPGNPSIYFEKVGGQIGICYFPPCFTQDEALALKYPGHEQNVKEFQKISDSYYACVKDKASHSASIQLTGDDYLYLTNPHPNGPDAIFDPSYVTDPLASNAKLSLRDDAKAKELLSFPGYVCPWAVTRTKESGSTFNMVYDQQAQVCCVE